MYDTSSEWFSGAPSQVVRSGWVGSSCLFVFVVNYEQFYLPLLMDMKASREEQEREIDR